MLNEDIEKIDVISAWMKKNGLKRYIIGKRQKRERKMLKEEILKTKRYKNVALNEAR